MTVSPLDVVRVTVTATVTDYPDEFQMVFHVQHGGASDNTDAGFMLFCDLWLKDLLDDFSTLTTDQITWERFEAYNVTKDIGVGEQALSGTITGQSTAEPLPYQSSALVTFPSLVKKVTGKKFIPGLTINDVDDGNFIDNDFFNALLAFAVTVLDGFSPAGQDYYPGMWSTLYERFVPALSAVVRSGVFTQRRRRLGQGR
jgi:hypothetical protein